MGVRDLFEGRQEPLSWYFRALAYDQSELDILESGAVETLHAPSTLVELVIDEMALACGNLGLEGLTSYLSVGPEDEESGENGGGEGKESPPPSLTFDSSALLGYLNLDVAPPARWLEERDSDARANERLATRLAGIAREIGGDSDTVEVHIEGAVDAGEGWAGASTDIRPAGVSVYFSFDIPMVGTGERELARIFASGARTAAGALERMRTIFRRD